MLPPSREHSITCRPISGPSPRLRAHFGVAALGGGQHAGEEIYQRAVAVSNPQPMAFPPAAQEVKAHWRDLGPSTSQAVLATYHWRRIGKDYRGLVALRMTTKDLPDWFWADF